MNTRTFLVFGQQSRPRIDSVARPSQAARLSWVRVLGAVTHEPRLGSARDESDVSLCVQGTSWARPAWRSSFLRCLVTWLEQLSGPIRFRQMLLPKLATGCNQHLSTLVTYCPFYYWTRVDPRYPYCPFCPLQSNHLQEVSLDHFSWFPCCSIAL